MLQIEMHNAMDDLKLVKMDFLGLKTLDVINDTLKLLGKKWEDLNIDEINLCDEEVYDKMYKKGDTIGVFQMESFEAKRMCMDCNTDNIEDVIAVNAFNRPGTKSNFPIYIKNKLEPNKVEVVHEDLKRIFEKSHFVLLYQEQALQIFRYAGFPENEIDLARRAIGHKEMETMKSLKEKFDIGMKNMGWNRTQIDEVWQLMMKQADYSFNRSHSVAYGLLSYVTAYYKYHYPAEFMASALNNEEDNGKISKLIANCKKNDVQVKRPNINKSEKDFYPIIDEKSKSILFGFSTLKGIGETSVDKLLSGRPYKSLEDFYDRCGLSIAQQIILAKAGAVGKPIETFNKLMEHKFSVEYVQFKPRTNVTPKDLKEKYNLEISNKEDNFKQKRIDVFNNLSFKDYEKKKRLDREKFMKEFKDKYFTEPEMWEFETMSMFITHNPFEKALSQIEDYDDIENGNAVTIIGVITNVTKKKDKNGRLYAFVDFYNGIKNIEVSFWSNEFSKYANGLKIGTKMAIFGKKDTNGLTTIEAKPYKKWLIEKNII
jgi:DNA polymerase-3 subunit alpha